MLKLIPEFDWVTWLRGLGLESVKEIEVEPHVTVLYGIPSSERQKLIAFVESLDQLDLPRVVLTSKRSSKFVNGDVTVIKFEVVYTPQLEKLRKKLLAEFTVKPEERDKVYQPHVTVAYVYDESRTKEVMLPVIRKLGAFEVDCLMVSDRGKYFLELSEDDQNKIDSWIKDLPKRFPSQRSNRGVNKAKLIKAVDDATKDRPLKGVMGNIVIEATGIPPITAENAHLYDEDLKWFEANMRPIGFVKDNLRKSGKKILANQGLKDSQRFLTKADLGIKEGLSTSLSSGYCSLSQALRESTSQFLYCFVKKDSRDRYFVDKFEAKKFKFFSQLSELQRSSTLNRGYLMKFEAPFHAKPNEYRFVSEQQVDIEDIS